MIATQLDRDFPHVIFLEVSGACKREQGLSLYSPGHFRLQFFVVKGALIMEEFVLFVFAGRGGQKSMSEHATNELAWVRYGTSCPVVHSC